MFKVISASKYNQIVNERDRLRKELAEIHEDKRHQELAVRRWEQIRVLNTDTLSEG